MLPCFSCVYCPWSFWTHDFDKYKRHCRRHTFFRRGNAYHNHVWKKLRRHPATFNQKSCETDHSSLVYSSKPSINRIPERYPLCNIYLASGKNMTTHVLQYNLDHHGKKKVQICHSSGLDLIVHEQNSEPPKIVSRHSEPDKDSVVVNMESVEHVKIAKVYTADGNVKPIANTEREIIPKYIMKTSEPISSHQVDEDSQKTVTKYTNTSAKPYQKELNKKSQVPHSCAVCEKECTHKSELVLHSREQPGSFGCRFCQKHFISELNLLVHRPSCEKFKQIKDKVSQHRLATRNQKRTRLIKQMQGFRNGSNPFTCVTCELVCGCSADLTWYEHSETGNFGCKSCHTHFNSEVDLLDHTQQSEICKKFKPINDKVIQHSNTVQRMASSEQEAKPSRITKANEPEPSCDVNEASQKKVVKHTSTSEIRLDSFQSETELTQKSEIVNFDKHGHYKCAVCEKVCTYKSDMILHDREQPGSFGCRFCQKHFMTELNLLVHRVSCEQFKEIKDKVSQCRLTTRNHTELAKQLQGFRHGINPFTCVTCEQVCDCSADLTWHMHSEKGRVGCKSCHTHFNSVVDLIEHRKQSEKCSAKPLDESIIETPAHFQQNDSGKSTKPSADTSHLEETVIKGKEDLPRYETTLPDSKMKHKCNFCGRLFSDENVLQRHLENVHLGLNELTCLVCEKVCYCSADLTWHEHKEQGYYGCKLCHEHFKSKADLLRHRLSSSVHHRLVRLFAAGTSPGNARLQSDITEEVKAGLLQRKENANLTLPSCANSSPSASGSPSPPELARRQEVKIEHKCNDCELIFTNERKLKRHEQVFHVDASQGEFACLVCKQKFRLRADLIWHDHSKPDDFGCRICYLHFKTESLLHKHIEEKGYSPHFARQTYKKSNLNYRTMRGKMPLLKTDGKMCSTSKVIKRTTNEWTMRGKFPRCQGCDTFFLANALGDHQNECKGLTKSGN